MCLFGFLSGRPLWDALLWVLASSACGVEAGWATELGKEGGRGCPCPASRGGRGPAQCLPMASSPLWMLLPAFGSLEP